MSSTVNNCSVNNVVVATSIDFQYKYVSLLFWNATSSTNFTVTNIKVLTNVTSYYIGGLVNSTKVTDTVTINEV